MGKRYYHFHERVYRQLLAEGHVGWGKKRTDAELDEFSIRHFLDRAIATFIPGPEGYAALEIGCGTGPVSCFLAERGFATTGIDISETAIAGARALAAKRKQNVRFEVRDLLHLGPNFGPFDVVVDANCMHCIVFDADRAAALAAVRRCLNADGSFIVETMTWHPQVSFSARNPRCRFDGDGILWSRAAEDGADHAPSDLVTFDGVPYFHQRRVVTAERFKAELAAAGFVVSDEEFLVQDDCDPNQLRLVCRPA